MHTKHAHFCVKKDGDTLFDATICSFGGAEVCLLAGLYRLDKVSKPLGSINAVLYRDDGLALIHDANSPKLDKLRKDIVTLLKNKEFRSR